MADIILKDKNANAVNHANVKQLRAKGTDGTHQTFTHMTGLYCYATEPTGDTIKITKKITSFANNEFWFFGCSDDDLKDYGYQMLDGGYGTQFLITRNGNLEVGKEYTTYDLT